MRCVWVNMDVPSRSGRFVGDLAASVGGVLILLVTLAAFSEGFRDQLGMGDGISANAIGLAVVGQMNNLALVVALFTTQIIRGQVAENASLVAFTGVTIVLVIFLLRM